MFFLFHYTMIKKWNMWQDSPYAVRPQKALTHCSPLSAVKWIEQKQMVTDGHFGHIIYYYEKLQLNLQVYSRICWLVRVNVWCQWTCEWRWKTQTHSVWHNGILHSVPSCSLSKCYYARELIMLYTIISSLSMERLFLDQWTVQMHHEQLSLIQ